MSFFHYHRPKSERVSDLCVRLLTSSAWLTACASAFSVLVDAWIVRALSDFPKVAAARRRVAEADMLCLRWGGFASFFGSTASRMEGERSIVLRPEEIPKVRNLMPVICNLHVDRTDYRHYSYTRRVSVSDTLYVRDGPCWKRPISPKKLTRNS